MMFITSLQNSVNSQLLLFEENVNIIHEPVVKEYDGFNIALVPWINQENYADSVDFPVQMLVSVVTFEIECIDDASSPCALMV